MLVPSGRTVIVNTKNSTEEGTLPPPHQVVQAVEAILMVATCPARTVEIAEAIGIDENTVLRIIERLRTTYDGIGESPRRGFELREVGGGWRIYARAEYAPVVERFVIGERTSRLSQAALETLAVVAYRQPVTRAQISAIRGVNVDGVVRTLTARGLIEEVGATETGALHYCTTELFLETFGLRSLQDLPPMAPHFPQAEQLPEVMHEIESLQR